MKKASRQNISQLKGKKWGERKKEEWKKNVGFWIEIMDKKLDPFRNKITNKAVVSSIRRVGKLKILDAGCGEGYLSRALAKRGHKVYGIDFIEQFILSAKNKEKKNSLGIKYFARDIRKTKFPEKYFDTIVSHQTINEINNPEKAFKEFSRIIKDNGQLILLFLHPCFEMDIKKQGVSAYFKKTKIKKGNYLVGGKQSPSPYFYLHLPLSLWTKYLEQNGFVIKKIGEPYPPKELLKKKWWKQNFKKPLFILIEALKI